jgi:hypothetical protein
VNRALCPSACGVRLRCYGNNNEADTGSQSLSQSATYGTIKHGVAASGQFKQNLGFLLRMG